MRLLEVWPRFDGHAWYAVIGGAVCGNCRESMRFLEAGYAFFGGTYADISCGSRSSASTTCIMRRAFDKRLRARISALLPKRLGAHALGMRLLGVQVGGGYAFYGGEKRVVCTLWRKGNVLIAGVLPKRLKQYSANRPNEIAQCPSIPHAEGEGMREIVRSAREISRFPIISRGIAVRS